MNVTTLLQRNDRIYLTAPVEVYKPSDDEVASFSNIETVKRMAPNSNLLWLRGLYTSEGGNRNRQAWTREELAIKSLTPNLMPVTIMHDFRTAVGVIAHTHLQIPEETAAANEPAYIETVLAIWAHRFPEIAEEVMMNHEAGSLMQSMECEAPEYSCSECSAHFVKPVDPADHCEHIQSGNADRTLHNVTFTGSGLIFGTRGRVGAHPDANLNVLAEVAEWSDARSNSNTKRSKTVSDNITITKAEYDELQAAKAKVADLDTAREKVEAEKARADEAETKATEAEAKAVEAEQEAASLREKVEAFETEKAEAELASKRLSEMPKELAEKLQKAEATQKLTARKARTLDDDEWQAEVASLTEVFGVKDTGTEAGETFSETAMRSFNPHGSNEATSSDDPSVGDLGRGVATMLRDQRKNKG